MTTLGEILDTLEQFAPPAHQQPYDNSGLLTGSRNMTIKGALLCLDITEEVIDEAIEGDENLIIAHHPLVFSAIKKFTPESYITRCIIKAIKNDIAIYCCHTNIDSVIDGVSFRLGEALGLQNMKILASQKDSLCKIVVCTPHVHLQSVKDALCQFGGVIGNYDNCSFSMEGVGSFRPKEGSVPCIGEIGQIQSVSESRVEVIVERHLVSKAISRVKQIHPYEEVGYDVYPMANLNTQVGLGVIGTLSEPINARDLPRYVSNRTTCKAIRYSDLTDRTIRTVALCGGSGAEFASIARAQNADVYITADLKYHDFFTEKDSMILMDIGHFESEIYTLDIFYDIISKKISTFAIRFSKKGVNPVNYFIGGL